MYGKRRSSAYVRQRIAETAARLMAEDGIDNFAVAKRKAVERLGLKVGRNLPDNAAVDAELAQYQRLFQGQTQSGQLRAKREAAIAAMRALSEFSPRLVGSVLSGTAGEHTLITLHLFSDSPEEVSLALQERGIPFELVNRRVRYAGNRDAMAYPCYRFFAGLQELEIVVFGNKELRQAPLSPIDGKPMRRADLAAVEALVNPAQVLPSD